MRGCKKIAVHASFGGHDIGYAGIGTIQMGSQGPLNTTEPGQMPCAVPTDHFVGTVRPIWRIAPNQEHIGRVKHRPLSLGCYERVNDPQRIPEMTNRLLRPGRRFGRAPKLTTSFRVITHPAVAVDIDFPECTEPEILGSERGPERHALSYFSAEDTSAGKLNGSM